MQGRSPLYLAVESTPRYETIDLIALLQLFVNNGGDVNHFLSNTSYGNGSSLLHIAIESVNGYTPDPYFNLCYRVCEFLLDNGNNYNKKRACGSTALHFACEQGNYIVVELLLERGANINIRDNDGCRPDDIMTKLRFNVELSVEDDVMVIHEGENFNGITIILRHQRHSLFCDTYSWLKQWWISQE